MENTDPRPRPREAAKQPGEPMQRYYDYLEELRRSGVTNMFGAGPYLIRKFGVSREESHRILGAWMKHAEDEADA